MRGSARGYSSVSVPRPRRALASSSGRAVLADPRLGYPPPRQASSSWHLVQLRADVIGASKLDSRPTACRDSAAFGAPPLRLHTAHVTQERDPGAWTGQARSPYRRRFTPHSRWLGSLVWQPQFNQCRDPCRSRPRRCLIDRDTQRYHFGAVLSRSCVGTCSLLKSIRCLQLVTAPAVTPAVTASAYPVCNDLPGKWF